MPEHRLRQALVSGTAALQLPLDPVQHDQLLCYLDLLAHWNKAYNLTAVRDPAAMVGLHLLDSLSVMPHLDGLAALADLGSGAGLPGIPIAIARPELRVNLIDSNGKKSSFQRQALVELGLKNVSVTNARVENLGNNQRFDAVISRAFTSLAQMIAWAAHIIPGDGMLFAMKGQYPAAELAELGEGTEIVGVERLVVPGVEADRHLVTLRLGKAG